MGRAPARAMGSGGRFKEGGRGLARPWLPLLIKTRKAKLYKNLFKIKSLSKNKNYKSEAFTKTFH